MLSAPEWLPDPTGRHAQRYWDGNRWTEAVDDGTGRPSEDALTLQPAPPAAVAGWYPDPAGRHDLRYWDGVLWSTSVTRAGAVSEDVGGGVDATTPGPRATVAAWYPDPSGRYPMRFWDTDHWTSVVSQGGRNVGNSDPDPGWSPPIGPRLPPPAPVGMRMARKAGWHMGASMTLKAQGRATCPKCGGKLTVLEAARPGCQIEYTPETTAVTYPPCASCGAVPPWAMPAGLYQDPMARHEFRYWDGLAWTDRVTDAGIGTIDPVGSPPPERS